MRSIGASEGSEPISSPARKHVATGFLRRIAGEPLAQFLVIGLAVFGADRLLGGEGQDAAGALRIELTPDDIRQISVAWLAQGRPQPTPNQLVALVDQRVALEVLAREARSMGLDHEDEVIKRRLAQKMEFLFEDVAKVQSPSTDELRAWFDANRDRFAEPPRIDFRHLYYSLERSGGSERQAAAAKERIDGHPADDAVIKVAASDPFMFQDTYKDAAPEQIAKEFGPAFSKAIFALPKGSWQGPLASGYGWHLVFVEAIVPGEVPRFEAVEQKVKVAWLDEHTREMKRKALEAMKARYFVVTPPLEDPALAARSPPQREANSMRAGLTFLLLMVLACCGAVAHEIRPAYLEIRETSPNRYEATWRTPLMSGMRLPVALALPDGARNLSLPVVLEGTDALIERREVEIPGGLAGKRLGFVGLEATITDVLVRLSLLDGRQLTAMVRPSRAYLDVDPSRGSIEVAKVYVVQGVEHILEGFDHLLFVFGLMLLVRDRWMLLKTITAFTLAHSLTLAAATFGIINVPAGPVEATIALSILFLGLEVVRAKQGRTSFTIRRPWAMAFAFGLLHGLGFASGLSMLGLPPADIPLALLAFNVGVEIGQLMFVAVIILLDLGVRLLRVRLPRVVSGAPAYIVGCLGAYWTLDRLAVMGGTWWG